jgi:hypothetical protein
MVSADHIQQFLSTHGRVRSQPKTDWTGQIPLPAFIEQFYRDVGPVDITIESYGNPYFLPRLSRL